MVTRHRIALILVLFSFPLLFLGLTEPILTITMKTKVVTNLGSMQADVLNKTRSIFGTVFDLYESDKAFVAFLILLFSVLVPAVKGALLLLALSKRGPIAPQKLIYFVRRIGKWSMADVMVIAVFIAYLSTHMDENTASKTLSVFGMQVNVEVKSQLASLLGPGFYWFVSYCLVSLVSLEFLVEKEG